MADEEQRADQIVSPEVVLPSTKQPVHFRVTGEKLRELLTIAQPEPPKPVEHLWPTWKDVKKKRDKVAIVGFAESRDLAPFQDTSWEIWGLNSLFEIIPPRHDRWFEIHDRAIFGMDTNREIGYGLTREGKPYMQALAELSMECPIYMVDQYDDIPGSVRYPLEEMIAAFDPMQVREEWQGFGDKYMFTNSAEMRWNGYFTNTISYMIALAIYEEYKEISVFGVDMATSNPPLENTEYSHQRPSCEYYLGLAVGRGIKTYIPPCADLLKARFNYGFELTKEIVYAAKCKKLRDGMAMRYQSAAQAVQYHQKQVDQYIGALECEKEMHKIWSSCAYSVNMRDLYNVLHSVYGKST